MCSSIAEQKWFVSHKFKLKEMMFFDFLDLDPFLRRKSQEGSFPPQETVFKNVVVGCF